MVVAIEEKSSKHKSMAIKTAAVQMWKANVPLMTIRPQFKLPERPLLRILERKRLGALRMQQLDYLKKLVVGMPRRLAEVIERGGACTKYYCVQEYNKIKYFFAKYTMF